MLDQLSLLTSHSHSHPPRLTVLTPVPEKLDSPYSSETASSPPSLNDQREESFQKLELAPQGSAHDGVNVVVTSDSKPLNFTIHRQLLCHFSPVFAALLDNHTHNHNHPIVKTLRIKARSYSNELDWDDDDEDGSVREEEEKDNDDEEGEIEVEVIVKLPIPSGFPKVSLPAQAGATSKEAFGAFVEWLYCGGNGLAVFPPLGSRISASTLVQLWGLAGRLGVPACQNECVVAIEMMRRQTSVIETCTIEWVYENTKEYARGECGLRNLLVDQCAWVLDDEVTYAFLLSPLLIFAVSGFPENIPSSQLLPLYRRNSTDSLQWIEGEDEGSEKADLFPRQALVDMVTTMKRMFGMAKGSEGFRPDFLYLPERRGPYWVQE